MNNETQERDDELDNVLAVALGLLANACGGINLHPHDQTQV